MELVFQVIVRGGLRTLPTEVLGPTLIGHLDAILLEVPSTIEYSQGYS